MTQGQWQSLMSDEPWSGKLGIKQGVDFPATYIDFESAVDFCRELTRQERQGGGMPLDWEYRLPTEAQWQYACRAGTTTAYHFGNDASRLGNYACFGENTHECGEMSPNRSNGNSRGSETASRMTGNASLPNPRMVDLAIKDMDKPTWYRRLRAW